VASSSSSVFSSAPARSVATVDSVIPALPARAGAPSLANHAQAIWAADLFVVQTLTFQTLYVLFFIRHGRRQLVHFEVTAHPTAAWVWRQLIEATPWNHRPRDVIHDRDRVWGADFGGRSSELGIKSLRTPVQAPRANSIAERWVRTIRRECLDHVIPLSELHLCRILAEFVDYYNHDRPHRSLALEPPSPTLGNRMARSLLDLSSADSTTSTNVQLE
jgi:transposase InsO family protein